MPRLWSETIEEHRRAVAEAIVDAAWGLVAERGLLAVTMSQVAEAAGIGRATLYKYFSDVESILVAGHERHVTAHLEHLVALRNRGGEPVERLHAVLTSYALMTHRRGRHGTAELGALLHRGEHVGRAHDRLTELVQELLVEAAREGSIRGDVAPAELASFCLHALGGAAALPSEAAARRLVSLTLAGLRPE